MAAVRAVIPVPAVHWCDPEGAELGQPALIASFCEGVTRPPREGAYTPRQGFGPRYRALLGPQFVRYLAELAKFDWRSSEVSAFDPPPMHSSEGVIKAINWWQRVWEEDCVEPYPLMTIAAQWLRENAPPIDHVSFVHRDFRGGNFLFRPADGKITAVLDWELVHLGDRHEDLAYFFSPLFSEIDENGVELMGGLYPRDEFIRLYEALSGLPVDPVRLALLRRVQPVAGHDQRARDGSADHDGREDPSGCPCRLDDRRHAADACGAPPRPERENLTMVPDFALRIQSMIRSLREVVLPALPNDQLLAIDQANILVGYLRIMAEQHDKCSSISSWNSAEYARTGKRIGRRCAGRRIDRWHRRQGPLRACQGGARCADADPASVRAHRSGQVAEGICR